MSVPKSAPAWIKEAAKGRDGKIYKANVEKLGTAQLQFVKLERNDKSYFKLPKKAGEKKGKK